MWLWQWTWVDYCTFVYFEPPSLKRVKIKRVTILGIVLVNKTNKLKKHRIVGLFKTTTNTIFGQNRWEIGTPLPPPPLPPPPIPQIRDGKIARFCSSRRFILDLRGWAFAVPFYSVHCKSEFSLFKQVEKINVYCFLCCATRHEKRCYCGKLDHWTNTIETVLL